MKLLVVTCQFFFPDAGFIETEQVKTTDKDRTHLNISLFVPSVSDNASKLSLLDLKITVKISYKSLKFCKNQAFTFKIVLDTLASVTLLTIWVRI